MIRIASLSKGEPNGETGLFSKVEPACLKHIIRKEDDRVTG